MKRRQIYHDVLLRQENSEAAYLRGHQAARRKDEGLHQQSISNWAVSRSVCAAASQVDFGLHNPEEWSFFCRAQYIRRAQVGSQTRKSKQERANKKEQTRKANETA